MKTTESMAPQTEKKPLFSSRDLRGLIVPLVIEQFLAISVGLADSVMVASAGETAVSAVSLIDTVMILLIDVFTALAAGGAIAAGQELGRGRREAGCEALEQTLLFSAALSVGITALVYLGKWFILHRIFGKVEPDVMEDCNIYLMIVAASIPFLAAYSCGAAAFRAAGDSRTPMRLSLVMNGLNIAGNAILLYGLGLGVEGAAVPTLLSRAFAGVWMLRLICDKKRILHVRTLSGLRLNPYVLRRILHIGVPYGMENSMFQLGKILVLSVVSGFGTMSVAANAVSNTICNFVILGGMSMGYALSSVAARCVGARDYEQVRYYTRRLLFCSYTSVAAMNLLLPAVLPAVLRLYSLSPETTLMVRRIMTYYAVVSTLLWPASFTLPNTLRAANDAGFCMRVSVISMWIFRVGFSYVLGRQAGMGVFGVWVAMTIDWVVSTAFFVRRYRGTKWQMHHTLP